MARIINVVSIDKDAMVLADTMAQSKYRLAQMKLEVAEQGDNLQEKIKAQESAIEAFEAIVDIIDRVADVEDGDGNKVPASALPTSAVEEIMRRMADDVEEMTDPNG